MLDGLVQWVESSDTAYKTKKQAIHIILLALSSIEKLRDQVYLKGGLLMGIKYKSSRYTTDIDLSNISKYDEDKIFDKKEFDAALRKASNKLSYGLNLKTQTVKLKPQAVKTFNSYQITIGYAEPGTNQNKKLLQGQASNTIKVDYSFNEAVHDEDCILVFNQDEIKAYGIYTLIAEKYRSLLQQITRNRYRKQDVYDLHFLIVNKHTGELDKGKLKEIIIKKCHDREGIIADCNSLEQVEVFKRAEKDYQVLAKDIDNELVKFDEAYSIISAYYKSLFDNS